MTFLLQLEGFGEASVDLYRDAQFALEDAMERGRAEGIWLLKEDSAALFEQLVTMYDWQLTIAAMRNIEEANFRLVKLAKAGLMPIPTSA
ncbi:hypothetical protein [Paraburkholderia sp. BL25I1N1]|uniref:hypothetical protein n=1 Tax=Paraburkholderia sp. BL25I1N1 TaxID=1938804 RepID=UPI000D42DAAC|nr:hypothetical protein [Paraburkholderia sp. BL25I1N1]PRY04461.1 hypothetical protein B0G73_112137 [Paraburkholderia sp. BL25I1N1]